MKTRSSIFPLNCGYSLGDDVLNRDNSGCCYPWFGIFPPPEYYIPTRTSTTTSFDGVNEKIDLSKLNELIDRFIKLNNTDQTTKQNSISDDELDDKIPFNLEEFIKKFTKSNDMGEKECSPFNNIHEFNVTDNDETYILEINVTGLGKDDIEITLEDNVLTVNNPTQKKQKKDYLDMVLNGKEIKDFKPFIKSKHVIELIDRQYFIPEDCDLNSISTICENGILTISVNKIQKVTKKSEIKQIKIN